MRITSRLRSRFSARRRRWPSFPSARGGTPPASPCRISAANFSSRPECRRPASSPRIAHGKTFAGDAAEVALALDGAIHHGVADDDGLFRHDRRIARRLDDDAAARQALADIVVAFAFEIEGDAARQPRAERLAGGALEIHLDGVMR